MDIQNYEDLLNEEDEAIDQVVGAIEGARGSFMLLYGHLDGEGGAILQIVREVLGIIPRTRATYSKARIPQLLRTQVFERDLYRCVQCATHLNLTVDHIEPESKGGTLELDNLQTLCRSCNSKKGSHDANRILQG